MPRRPSNRYTKLRTPIPAGDFTPFHPRSYQRNLLQAFSIDPETKRPRARHGVWVAHRKSGKDMTVFCGIFLPAIALHPANYFYIFPQLNQAKRAIWQEEETFLDRIPPHWQPERKETELFVEMRIPPAGKVARLFLLGADDEKTVSRLVGANPAGVGYSEAAQIDPTVRGLLRPVLAVNGGWELLFSTPRGKNELHRLYQMALGNPAWFAEPVWTVEGTIRDSAEDRRTARYGQPVVSLEEIAEDRRSGMPEELIQQEYYCSFEGAAVGTIYGNLLQQARRDGRITQVPHDPKKPVGIMLDIGRSDLTAIWFWQVENQAIRLIDYHAARGLDSTRCIRFLKDSRPYRYGRVILPFDAKERRFQAARYESVQREFQVSFGCPVVVAHRVSKDLQHNTVRRFFPRLWFDAGRCGREIDVGVPSGLDSLLHYRRAWSEERKEYSHTPVHDQYSHGADALAVGLVAWQEGLEAPGAERLQSVAVTAFDPFGEVETEHYAHSVS